MPDPVTVASLWLPILIATVLVFVASSIVWMVLPHHKNDYGPLPDEEKVMAQLRDAGVREGQYAFPNCGGDMKLMSTPEFVAKMEKGPVGFLTVGPNGPPAMGMKLVQWTVYVLVVSIFVAYLTGQARPAGAAYLDVFQVAGATAVLGYCAATVPNAIWKSQQWGSVVKELIDGAVYGLLTAGAFAGFWPGV